MISTAWYDDEQTIIVHQHPAVWGVEEFQKARATSLAMIATVNHRVDLILLHPGMKISTEMLYYARESLSLYPPDTGFVVVDDFQIAALFVRTFRRLHPEVYHRVDYVRSMDEAVSAIGRMRSGKHLPG
ncbi:MAG: hypothetical protein AAFV33_06110 [Chloroflexota bacterium]